MNMSGDDEDRTGFFVHCVDENVTVDIEHFPNFKTLSES